MCDWEREDREKQKGGRRVEGVICVSVEEGLAALSWGSGSSLMVAHISSCLNIISEVRCKILLEGSVWSRGWCSIHTFNLSI